ncbi:uncharacterized protein LOC111015343 isoform X2 [Momordica charantia]|uniref:Uncharacterized protein LOC111015343 isoform X2 n=1 Tax=Momordica charantia TaxID=3673 RepID=A0A6J1CY61_MOMCH|nr:uncharacterized protein LOC111015343 isoform X2 [Momordica charantia]
MITHLCSLRQSPTSPFVSTFLSSSPSSYPNFGAIPRRISVEPCRLRNGIICGAILPVDPWAPNIDSQSIASQVFAFSLFPYIGFLYFITKSKTAPKLTLFGFYFLLAFVGATSLAFAAPTTVQSLLEYMQRFNMELLCLMLIGYMEGLNLFSP